MIVVLLSLSERLGRESVSTSVILLMLGGRSSLIKVAVDGLRVVVIDASKLGHHACGCRASLWTYKWTKEVVASTQGLGRQGLT